MDDVNQRIQAARRAQALADAARHEAEAASRNPAPEPVPAVSAPGTGRLSMERRQGEWRYYLCDERLRVGDPIEFYVDRRVGWIRGVFQWGRRNTSAATIRVTLEHPDGPEVGEMEVNLPADALCRRPPS